MKTGITINELITEVQRQSKAKLDLLANTREQLRMVSMAGYPHDVALVTLAEGQTELNRFKITDNCHQQIATTLGIPYRYYDRLLNDHTDMVIEQVNKLFEREPSMRMVRTLDDRARAFLSDRFRRIDNDLILAKTLPKLANAAGELPASRIIGSHLTEDSMRIRVLWTDPALEQEIGTTRDGKPDTVKPGFEISNSETGRGKEKIRGFFYRGWCDNGCIWQFGEDTLEYSRTHLGGKLQQINGLEIFSDETKRKDDEAMIAQISDIMRALGDPAFAEAMGATLRSLKKGPEIAMPSKAITVLARDIGLYENEIESVLASLVKEGDLSRWGALNAVTSVANLRETSEERSFELQEIGAQVIQMSPERWKNVAYAGIVRQAA